MPGRKWRHWKLRPLDRHFGPPRPLALASFWRGRGAKMEQIPGTGRTFEIYAENEYGHVRFVYFRT